MKTFSVGHTKERWAWRWSTDPTRAKAYRDGLDNLRADGKRANFRDLPFKVRAYVDSVRHQLELSKAENRPSAYRKVRRPKKTGPKSNCAKYIQKHAKEYTPLRKVGVDAWRFQVDPKDLTKARLILDMVDRPT